ncbi:MAG TPA: biotin--[acetyl-CoA-carboxylase] ligase [Patescibacteria group bacterium]|nr:biotin--[acetyl-CoA-carboxylase] ligase [Patescibacteria group bacterium]
MTTPDAAPALVRLGRVDSTQTVAFALAADGAADRTVVVAQAQTAGRGRHGRLWLDEPGASLLTSIILRPRLEPARLPTLSLAAGVAVVEALERVTGLKPRLKWPNDVLVDGRKLAGILLESRISPSPLVVLGIGVNLAQRVFPADLAERATSVRLATGRRVDADALLTALLESLDAWRTRLETEGWAPIRERWRALTETLGRRVSIDGVEGVAVDVDEDGALIVAEGDVRRRVVAGEVN